MSALHDTLYRHDQLYTLAESAVTRYPENAHGMVTELCHSENATYRVDTPDGNRFAMRVHRTNYHNRTNIESELAWLDALRSAGFEVPQAIAGNDRHYVQSVQNGHDIKRNIVLFKWIDGVMPSIDVDMTAFQQLGAITANLHNHSRRWAKPVWFKRLVWDHETMVGAQGHWGDWRNTAGLNDSHSRLINEALCRVREELLGYGKGEQHYGLIHADLRLTNLLILGGTTRVIDFDDCGYGWYMHDLAAALSFIEHHQRINNWIENWLKGYEVSGHLDDRDIAMIPTFIIQRRIQLLAWVGSHAGTKQAQELGVEWVAQSVSLCDRYLDDKMLSL